ncbi:hypothetical protein [Terriglobus aquaticus]|uniref:Uncharacterized protein n=1 Tax=Terriglobus aquaticus TaxID=940139 RepID=A0ABW9KIV1_9BACT|nr:hypothetical protein [Terriglobus aquaticus]
MKIGTEDRKKLILAGTLGVLALGTMIYELAGSSSDTPSPAPAPVTVARPATPSPVAAHVSSAALDPTLHPEGMQAAEALLYTGSGRNIFLAGSQAAVKTVSIPKPIAPVRIAPVQSIPTGPPPPPPIDLRFFGTEQRRGGKRQAFFLKGDDVFLATEGDIVGRRYRVGPITGNSAQVTDLTNNNTQTLPLVQQ